MCVCVCVCVRVRVCVCVCVCVSWAEHNALLGNVHRIDVIHSQYVHHGCSAASDNHCQ